MKSISQIKELMQPGDLKTAAQMLGITASNASKALNRPGSKYHQELVNSLSMVVEMREMLIDSKKRK